MLTAYFPQIHISIIFIFLFQSWFAYGKCSFCMTVPTPMQAMSQCNCFVECLACPLYIPDLDLAISHHWRSTLKEDISDVMRMWKIMHLWTQMLGPDFFCTQIEPVRQIAHSLWQVCGGVCSLITVEFDILCWTNEIKCKHSLGCYLL
jgi:hypothetical protein